MAGMRQLSSEPMRMQKICLLLIVFAFLLAPRVQADIFMYEDSDGVMHIGNSADIRKKGNVFLKEIPRHRIPTGKDKVKIMEIIQNTAKKHGVDPNLVKAVAQAESNFRPDAVSPKGAVGVMQLMPATADRFKVRDIYHPEDNIDGGIRYLKFLLGLFPKDLTLALAAYNAGENRVLKAGTIPNIRETQEYVDRVIRFYNGFKGNSDGPTLTHTVSRQIRKTTRIDGTVVLSNL